MLRKFLTAGAILALAPALFATDTIGPGWGLDEVRVLTAPTAFANYDTLANGNRVVYDGSTLWLEQDDGVVLATLGSTPGTSPNFVEADPTGTFVLFGEYSTGLIYRSALAGGGIVPLTTLPQNYALVYEPGGSTALVSAATCGFGCGNEIHRLDVTSGATTLVASVTGPSGPLALAANGDLYYAVQVDTFPTPPGAIDVVRWTAAQVASGPFPLTLAQASAFTTGLDGAGSMAFDPAFGHLFVSQAVYLGVSSVTEIDRFGTVVGPAASASANDTMGKLEIFDAPGAGSLGAWQPAGARLQYRTTDFNQGTSQIVRVSPRRPGLTAQQNGPTMTCTITGAQPSSSCFVISSLVALYDPNESAHDLALYQFWTGMPLANIRRAGIQFNTDANGTGSFTFQNPPSIQGTRVIQVLVRDANGTFRGSSATVTN
jgi:hypothetical protein